MIKVKKVEEEDEGGKRGPVRSRSAVDLVRETRTLRRPALRGPVLHVKNARSQSAERGTRNF
eukprot:6297867-Pyramimonas_sp.AAC.1